MRRTRLAILLCFLLLIPTQLLAAEVTYNLGKLETGSINLNFEGYSLETYQIFDAHYIPVSKLQDIGCNVTYTHDIKQVDILSPIIIPTVTTSSALNLNLKSYSLYDGTVYIGGFPTHAVISEGRILIPIGALRQLYTITIDGKNYTLTHSSEPPVIADRESVSNPTDYPLTVTLVDLYYKDDFIYKENTYTIAPYETVTRNLGELDDSTLYISTLVKAAQGDTINYKNGSTNGQTNAGLFKRYMQLKNRKPLDTYGDEISLEDVIKAEETVNNLGLSSSTPYLVWTNIATQKTYIFEGSKGNWTLLKHFICSTGKDRTPTPKGSFKLTYKVPSFGQNKGYCCKNAYGFIGTTYLYHSILFDRTGSYLLEGRGVLGQKASDGCIRFSPENAEWFYNTLISGTTVWID